MKKILGLDLGTGSIGWAVVNEAENPDEKSSIIKIGVRVNPLTADEKQNFEKGKSITTNSDRTLKRSMRRNLQRYKLRRNALMEIMKEQGWITDDTILAEQGNNSTYSTLNLRAKAATEEISLEDLAKVLLMINKKRGYKSSRKVKNEEEEGQAVDSMETARQLHDSGMTPGEFAYRIISEGNFNLPDFYRSDLQDEFDRIWEKQREYYPEILTDSLKEELKDKNEKQTWKICEEPFDIEGIKRTVKGKELIKENYEWRTKALNEMLDMESLAIVLQKINGQIKNAGGYLGNISDRSKELYFNGQTVGQCLAEQIRKDPNTSLKNQVYYRQDYMDEFDRIWETQAAFHPELTPALKKEIKDTIIFWQRPLKSQKGLVNICEFEHWETETASDGKSRMKTVGPKVCPKSSPLFQEFKIWQIINNLKVNGRDLEQSDKEKLATELSIREKMSGSEVLKFLYKNPKQLNLNYREVDGNRTGAALFKAFAKIIELSGHGEYDEIMKLPSEEALKMAEEVFNMLGINAGILYFDSSLSGAEMENQPMFRLWHLLYSYEGDKSRSGNESLIDKISELFGFEREYAKIVANVTFAPDYGSLSSKAIRKILPYMKDGMEYSMACEYAGYRHSAKSLTKEELASKAYKDKLELLPKNSLRNPVVEKILNQMANVVNGIIEEYGKPDEIRIELARELKKSQQERKAMTEAISKSSSENERIEKLLQDKFGIARPSRNDIIRYKLYEELESNGYKTLYTGTYIPEEKLFSKEFDIEHIIPQAKLFDDSMSNKTLESRQANIEKGNSTALDYVKSKFGESGVEQYRARIEKLFKDGKISRTKQKNLLTEEKDIPSGFINRDLRDSQYIAKKAKEMLEDVVGQVVTTAGTVTDRLREDWQLVDVMKELNWEKYDRLGLTEIYKDKDGRTIRKIKDWTKRNDHRHHAMDALTIAFTKRSYIQYLNNLNARIPKEARPSGQLSLFEINDTPADDRTEAVISIEKSQLYRDSKGKLRFIPPIPLDTFRAEAKRHLENTLVSIKAKNKVVTRNVNISKKKGGVNRKVQLTPRGELHNETIYGSICKYSAKEEKVGSGFTFEKIQSVAKPLYRKALEKRLALFGNDPKKAFTGKNSLDKNPLFADEMHTIQVPASVKTITEEVVYTVRKEINPTNFKDAKTIEKVVDLQVRRILLKRLEEFGGNAAKAFSNLDENPIWLNEKKGISIKRATITGKSNVIALHDRHDNLGHPISDKLGRKLPSDYVSTGNNHHIAIFRDADGNLQEEVVPFFDAVERMNQGLPVIDIEYKKDEGWEFLFTMKQNEYFVFPNPDTGFNPQEIDLMNPDNYAIISPNLFRVQKLATKYYVFRHHLETNVNDNTVLKEITWKRITMLNKLKGIVKVRINHLGQIVQTGEY